MKMIAKRHNSVMGIIFAILVSLFFVSALSSCSDLYGEYDEISSNSSTKKDSKSISVTGVSVTPSSLSLAVKGTKQLTITVFPYTATNKAVTWISSKPSIATVSSVGVVTGVSTGSAKITVKTVDGGFTASCIVTISSVTAVTGVLVAPVSVTLDTDGTAQLTETIIPANATNVGVTWSSSNTLVATVTLTGYVTGVSAGTAIITAKTVDGGFTAGCVVTVKLPIGSVSGNMVAVTGGTFYHDTTRMTVSSFHIGKYEVTQKQYADVMGSIPSSCSSTYGLGANYPVYYVSWYNAVAFCNALSAQDGYESVYTISGTTVTTDFTKNGYRLPTEAEWEFAARGGNSTHGYTYAGSNAIDSVAWYSYNARSNHMVGTKSANELGLCDMSGNVWEWCQDWHGLYPLTEQTNYTGASSDTQRVVRGGSWYGDMSYCEVSSRGNDYPSDACHFGGFRVLRVP